MLSTGSPTLSERPLMRFPSFSPVFGSIGDQVGTRLTSVRYFVITKCVSCTERDAMRHGFPLPIKQDWGRIRLHNNAVA